MRCVQFKATPGYSAPVLRDAARRAAAIHRFTRAWKKGAVLATEMMMDLRLVDERLFTVYGS